MVVGGGLWCCSTWGVGGRWGCWGSGVGFAPPCVGAVHAGGASFVGVWSFTVVVVVNHAGWVCVEEVGFSVFYRDWRGDGLGCVCVGRLFLGIMVGCGCL